MKGSQQENIARSMWLRSRDDRASWRRSAAPTFLRRLPRGSLWLLALGALLTAYGSSSCSSSGSTGTSCASAGGACVLGGALCARRAPSSAQDCETNPPNPGGAFCCLALSDAGSLTVDSGPDAAETGGDCVISASSYDQSCMQDTDCVEVTATNYCNAEACLCGGSAINMNALAQFNADVATTPLGLHPGGGGCPCASLFGPCCRQGTCTAECSSPADTLPACADAGGTCIPSSFAMCGSREVPDACAYSDEVCCAN